MLCVAGVDAAPLMRFNDLSQDLQHSMIKELGARPVIVSDISKTTQIDDTYVGIFTKNGQTYSFEVFIWYGTQGADAATIYNITHVPAMNP